MGGGWYLACRQNTGDANYTPMAPNCDGIEFQVPSDLSTIPLLPRPFRFCRGYSIEHAESELAGAGS